MHGKKVACGAPTITHLLFLNDCLLFCKTSLQEYEKLKNIL